MSNVKYPKLARAIATEFTPAQIKILLRDFGQGGVDPRAIGSGCGQGCGAGCGNNCRRAVGFVFDEFGYLGASAKEIAAAASDPAGLRRSVTAQVQALLR